MNFMDRFRYLIGTKESQARIVTSFNQVGKPVSTPANYEAFATFGYSKNSAVYTSISKITTAAKGITWNLYERKGRNKVELLDHPFLNLWNNPNPLESSSSFVEQVIGYKLISGNSYIESNRPNPSKPPLELWAVRPDKMRVIPNSRGYVQKYTYTDKGQSRSWDVDQVTLKSDILHMKNFNPLNQWYGMSPLQAAIVALDQNNAGKSWNLAMLQNQATPSGVLQMKISDGNPRGELTDKQYQRLKSEFDSSYIGAKNAGRPLIIEGGLNWASMSLSPKEMQYLEGNKVSTTEIALIYGVPPELIGVGERTYSNFQEARAALYEDTVLPILDNLRDDINKSILPSFGEGLYIDYDRDDIEALAYKREAKYVYISGANYLNQNEKREAVGYDKIPGWDVFVIANQIVENPEDFVTPGIMQQSFDDGKSIDEKEPNREQDFRFKEIAKGYKAVNLLTANEKRRAWKFQNSKRQRLSSSFSTEVEKDYSGLTKLLSEEASRLKAENITDKKVTEFALLNILDSWTPILEETLEKNTRLTIEDFGGLIFNEAKSQGLIKEEKSNRKFQDYIDQYVMQRTGTQISTIANTTQKRIKRIVSEWVTEGITAGDTLIDLSKFIEAEFENLGPKQSMRIARTEVSMASNNGTLGAVKALQIPNMQKEWVNAGDGRVRDGSQGYADHASMNGVVVGVDEKFNVPFDATMEGPGDPSAAAEQVINCRCVLVFKSKN